MAISEYPKHITTHLNPGEKVAKVQLLKDWKGCQSTTIKRLWRSFAHWKLHVY